MSVREHLNAPYAGKPCGSNRVDEGRNVERAVARKQSALHSVLKECADGVGRGVVQLDGEDVLGGAWLLGMHNLFAFQTVQSGEGIGNEFLYIVAAVVGGCLLTGGYGSAIGGAIGALIYGMALSGVVYAEWNPDWLRFFLGAMLLGATVLNFTLQRRAAKGGGKKA